MVVSLVGWAITVNYVDGSLAAYLTFLAIFICELITLLVIQILAYCKL